MNQSFNSCKKKKKKKNIHAHKLSFCTVVAAIQPSLKMTVNIYIHEKTRHMSQTRAQQGPLLSPYNWAQCCYCIHKWKRPTFSSHQYRTNIVQAPQPLFHVKGAVLKVDGALDRCSFSNEIFNEPMFCAVGSYWQLCWGLWKVIWVEWARLAALWRNIMIM